MQLWFVLMCVVAGAMLLLRLSAYGIWDPWELSTADAARKLLEGGSGRTHTHLTTWLVSRAFSVFGVHEWAGRLPIALCGLLTVGLSFSLVRRYSDARTGFYAALVTLTSPMFLLNSRAMLGEAPSFLLQAAVGYCAMAAAFPARSHDGDSSRIRALWLAALTAVATLTVVTRGALLGLLPPLAAVAFVAWLLRDPLARGSLVVPTLLAAAGCIVTALIARDVLTDSSVHSVWLGGRVLASAPPTFEAGLEDVFHGFAPWSALLPIAAATLWYRSLGAAWIAVEDDDPRRRETPLALVAVVWAVLGYGAQTLYVSRYGADVTYLPVVAMASLVALLLSLVERRGGAHWGLALTALFLSGLILRDFALFPNSPVGALPIAGFELPKAFNPKGAWAALLAIFGACAALGLGADANTVLDLRAPYRFVRTQWQRGLVFKVSLIVLALTLFGVFVLGVLGYTMPKQLGMPTVALKWVKRLVFVPPAILGGVAGFQLALSAFGKLGGLRFVPTLIAGAAIGGYTAHVYLPAFSEHLSPREVYDTYNQLAKPGEVLGQYHVGGRAATYYAKGKVVELTSQAAVIEHLNSKERRWVAFPAEELPALDRAFRKRSGEHLVAADARSARVVLGTNLPLAGKPHTNFLQTAVRKQPPARIQNPTTVNFDDRIELLGYDLKLPHDGYVGAGETFKITWYFRCKQPVTGAYKVFIHIDGEGQRIHGDHEPVDGKYPVRMWDEGDVIYDEHELVVPSTYASGEYVIYLGFYAGNSRLPVKGPSDDNRVRVGVLRIR